MFVDKLFETLSIDVLQKQTVWQSKIRASILIDILVYYVLANSLLRRERLHRVYCFVTYFAHTVHTIIYIHLQANGYSMMTSIYIKFLLFVEKLRRKRCVSYCRMYIYVVCIQQRFNVRLIQLCIIVQCTDDSLLHVISTYFPTSGFQLIRISITLSLSSLISHSLERERERERIRGSRQ